MLNESESLDLIESALGAAGGDQADAVVISSRKLLSRFAGSNLHQNSADESASLALRVVLSGGRMGIAQTSALEPEEIRRIAALAAESAARNDPAPGFRGLYEGGDPLVVLETFDEATASHPAAKTAELLATIFARGSRAGITLAGSASSGSIAIATGNSRGVRRYAAATQADASFIAIGEEGTSGYATGVARQVGSLDLPGLAAEATGRATLLRGIERTIEPGPLAAIVEPPAIAEVFEWMNMVALSGQAYEDGSSFLSGRLGELLLSERCTVTDDPLDPGFLPFPFDMEGMPKRRVTIVEQGVARTPLVDKLYADRLSLTPTASAAGLGSEEHGSGLHLSIAPGQSSREELIRGTPRGVLITRFHYVNGLLDPRVALMTGMTRDGTFLIEDGRLVARLGNLRWTQSMVEALSGIDGLSRERRAVPSYWNPVGGTLAPTIKFGSWRFNG